MSSRRKRPRGAASRRAGSTPVHDELTRIRDQIDDDERRAADTNKRRVTEAELMQLAFDGISGRRIDLDWDRVEVVEPPADGAEKPMLNSDQSAAPVDAVMPPSTSAVRSNDASSLERQIHRLARRLTERSWTTDTWSSNDHGQAPAIEHAQRVAAALRCVGLPELNLRRLPAAVALSRLEQFVARQRAAQQRLVRVITGKGIYSRGDPVLKDVVVQWCRSQAGHQVVGCSPEPDGSGEFGAIIVELMLTAR